MKYMLWVSGSITRLCAAACCPASLHATSHLDAGQLPTLQQLGLSTASLQRSAADPAAAGAQLKGGETQALAHLRSFLSELQQGAAPQPAPTSSSTSSSSAGAGAKSVDARSSSFSCRISPWLALGCLSPREMYHQLLKQAGGAQQQGLKQGAGRPGGEERQSRGQKHASGYRATWQPPNSFGSDCSHT
jgi:hypothetical protein